MQERERRMEFRDALQRLAVESVASGVDLVCVPYLPNSHRVWDVSPIGGDPRSLEFSAHEIASDPLACDRAFDRLKAAIRGEVF